MNQKLSEEIWMRAILEWKSLHPDKDYLDIKQSETVNLEGIGEVNIGKRIIKMRIIYKAMQEGKHYRNFKDLTEETIKWYKEQGMIWDYEKWQKEVYKKAILKWKRLHPEKFYLDIKAKETIDLEGIGKVKVGNKISNMRQLYKAMQEGKQYGTCKDLTEEEIAWYREQGMIWDYEKWQEEVYKKAILKWKKLHSEKAYLDIKAKETIDVEGIGKVKIGNKISNMRQLYKAMQEGESIGDDRELTEEEMAWYEEQEMIWDYEKWQEEVYKKAILKWKRLHPEEFYLDIKAKETIDLEGIGEVNIGKRLNIMRQIYKAMQERKYCGTSKDLTEEEIAWYKEQGMIWDYEKWQEEVYKKAILKWKRLHPEKNYLDIKWNEIIDLEGIGEVKIGRRLSIMRQIYKAMQEGKQYGTYKNLIKETIKWYEEQGMIWDYEKWQEEVYKKAILEWKRLHPEKEYLDIKQKETVNLEGIGEVNIGNRINIMRQIYKAMQEGKSYKNNKDLTEEEIAWYEGQGMCWNCSRRKKSNKIKEESEVNSKKIEITSNDKLTQIVLNRLNLNQDILSNYISKIDYPIEEIIKQTIFDQSKRDNKFPIPKTVYNHLIKIMDIRKNPKELEEQILIDAPIIIEEFGISVKDYNIVAMTFLKYANTLRTYQIYEVGLETNYQEKLNKIEKYNLTREEIEESLLVPLEFKNKKLVDSTSEEYTHRQMIRQYVIDWNEYTDEEKIEAIKRNGISQSEVLYIEKTREKIDQVTRTVQLYRKKGNNKYVKK